MNESDKPVTADQSKNPTEDKTPIADKTPTEAETSPLENPEVEKKETKKVLKTVIAIFVTAGILLGGLFVYFNYHFIRDTIRGFSYQPTEEVSIIESELSLTRKGQLIFRSSYPSLETKDLFNVNCASYDVDLAVLGCYINDEIHVYDIDLTELEGVRQSTMAHEFLHAVWARMSDSDRSKLSEALTTVYEENKDHFEATISTYPEEARLNEMFARAGTEIKDLPEKLELFYARYFENQDLVVSYYEKYAQKFAELSAEAEELKYEIQAMDELLQTETADYTTRAEQLSADINEFNQCAETTGCFSSTYEFQTRRQELASEQQELKNLYNKIYADIEKYNQLVEKYNNNVTQTNSLYNAINSNSLPEV